MATKHLGVSRFFGSMEIILEKIKRKGGKHQYFLVQSRRKVPKNYKGEVKENPIHSLHSKKEEKLRVEHSRGVESQRVKGTSFQVLEKCTDGKVVYKNIRRCMRAVVKEKEDN